MDLNGMEFQNKILITSGCSFTAGGQFNNKKFFLKEFPEQLSSVVIHGFNVINEHETQFKEFIKEHLWPHKLGKLLNTKKTYNLASSGKGLKTSLDNLYNCIFKLIDKNENSNDFLIIYQVPTHLREELVINNHEKSFQCVTTELEDTDEDKIEYLLRFHDSDYLYRNYINELYKFQKFCNLLNIKLIMWSWEYGSLNNQYLENLKERIKEVESLPPGDQRYLIEYKSIDENKHIDIDMMIDSLNFISFGEEKTGMQQYSELINVKDFNFAIKYPSETDDKHPTREGCDFIAKTLYEKIFV